MRRFLFTLFLSLIPAACSCGHIKANPDAAAMRVDVMACAKGAVPDMGDLAALVDQTVASLSGAPGAPEWKTFSETTLMAKGIDVAHCAVEAAWHDLHVTFGAVHGQMMPAYTMAAQRRAAWLAKHNMQPANP